MTAPIPPSNIVLLGNVKNDNALITPEQALEDCLADIRSGALKCNKILILPLYQEDGFYNFHHNMANMRTSEAVALLSATLSLFVEYLRGK